MKLHAVMQMKNIGERIGNFPALGEPGRDIEIIAAREQIIEDQIVDALRLRIDSDSRVEIRGARFDHHHQRVGIGLVRAGEQEKASNRQSCEPAATTRSRISGSPGTSGGGC